MYDIEHTFTIQWVGPFKNLNDYQSYLKSECPYITDIFSFYYFYGNKKGSGHPRNKKDYRYIGIHTAKGGIEKRLNSNHEHLSDFFEYEIWIGTFANDNNRNKFNAELVESLLISTYKNILTENIKKKKSLPKESIAIINLWYRRNRQHWRRKKADIALINDTIFFEKETQMIFKGNLTYCT